MDEATHAAMWDASRPSARRSLILCAVGALIGLAIAGAGLFTAKGTRTSGVPAQDVAIVNQVPILMSDYVQQLRALYDVSLTQATPAQKRKVLNDMIREELFVQRGVELGLQSDTIEVRQALVGAVEAQSAADARMAQPPEAELRAWFDTHRADYASEGVIALADYVLAPGEPADAAAAVLRRAGAEGEVPPSFARRTAEMRDGEEYYFAARLHLGPRLFDAARRLRAGEVSAPVPMPDGVHLLVIAKNIMPVPERFEDVRDKVLTADVEAQAKRLTAGNERFLRKRADILIAPGFE